MSLLTCYLDRHRTKIHRPEEHARLRGTPFRKSTEVLIQSRLEHITLLTVKVSNGPCMDKEIVVAPLLGQCKGDGLSE